MATNVYTNEGKIEIGYNVYKADGWYGKNYFYYLKVDSKTKTEAKKNYQSMIRKYLLTKFTKEELNGLVILKKGDTQTTYIHSTGPCFHLNRIKINEEEFNIFREKELERLRKNREESEMLRKIREEGDGRRRSQRRVWL